MLTDTVSDGKRREDTRELPRHHTRQLPRVTALRSTRRILIALLGGAVVLIGLALIPLPGPGWVVIFLGLTVLSWEFIWAKRLLQGLRKKLKAIRAKRRK